MSDDGKPLVVALFWRLIGFGVDSCVIDNGKVSGKAWLMASRVIMSPERTSDSNCVWLVPKKRSTSPPGRVAWWSVDEFNAEVVTGRAHGVRVVDLGIVEVEFFGRAVDSPGPDERIDKDIEVCLR
ncbi:MAG: hypothetical protein HS127_13490 [Planctomycetia bacterium]|nr:hypothetical protein [Planctomycetia bacterium]